MRRWALLCGWQPKVVIQRRWRGQCCVLRPSWHEFPRCSQHGVPTGHTVASPCQSRQGQQQGCRCWIFPWIKICGMLKVLTSKVMGGFFVQYDWAKNENPGFYNFHSQWRSCVATISYPASPTGALCFRWLHCPGCSLPVSNRCSSGATAGCQGSGRLPRWAPDDTTRSGRTPWQLVVVPEGRVCTEIRGWNQKVISGNLQEWISIHQSDDPRTCSQRWFSSGILCHVGMTVIQLYMVKLYYITGANPDSWSKKEGIYGHTSYIHLYLLYMYFTGASFRTPRGCASVAGSPGKPGTWRDARRFVAVLCCREWPPICGSGRSVLRLKWWKLVLNK